MFSNLRSLIFKLDPETAHNLAIKSLKFNFIPNITNNEKNSPLFKTKLFNKNLDNFRISNLHQKIDNLKNLNVDFLIIKKFDRKFSKIKSITFIKEILGKKLKPKFIFVSNNFRFGNKRAVSYTHLTLPTKA